MRPRTVHKVARCRKTSSNPHQVRISGNMCDRTHSGKQAVPFNNGAIDMPRNPSASWRPALGFACSMSQQHRKAIICSRSVSRTNFCFTGIRIPRPGPVMDARFASCAHATGTRMRRSVGRPPSINENPRASHCTRPQGVGRVKVASSRATSEESELYAPNGSLDRRGEANAQSSSFAITSSPNRRIPAHFCSQVCDCGP